MTIRPEVGRVWASAASTSNVQDPDKYTPGKVNLGWVSEIPPYQWFNWLLKRNDELKRSLVERGIAAWGSDVTYLKGALAYNDADFTIYICLKENKGIQPDKDNGTNWVASAVQITKDDFLRLTQILDDHVKSKNNPHNVTAAQIDAYTKAQIDALLNKYNGDFNKHLQDFNNPHKTTAAAAGAVPITGGKYTGVVEFTQARMVIGSTTSGFDTSDNYTRIFKDDKGLGINVSGKPVFSSGSTQKELLYSENFSDLTLQNNPVYAVPTPDMYIPLSSDICIYEGGGYTEFSRSSRATYRNLQGKLVLVEIDEPRHEPEGLLIEGATTNHARSVVGLGSTSSAPSSLGVGTSFIYPASDPRNYTVIRNSLPNNTLTAGSTYTVSCFAKGIPDDVIACIHRTGSNVTGLRVYPSSTKYFGGWRRYSGTYVADGEEGNFGIGFVSTGVACELCNLQIEGNPVATSYIPTDDVPVTKMGDVLTLPIGAAPKQDYTVHLEYTPLMVDYSPYLEVYLVNGLKYNIIREDDGFYNSYTSGSALRIGKAEVGKKAKLTKTFASDNTHKVYLDNILVVTANQPLHTPSTEPVSAALSGRGHYRNFKVWGQVLTPEQISTL